MKGNTSEVNAVGIKSPLSKTLFKVASYLTDVNQKQNLAGALKSLNSVKKVDQNVDGLKGYYLEVSDDINAAFATYQLHGEENSYLADLRLASMYEGIEHYQNAFYYYQLAMEKFGDSFALSMMIYYLENKLVDYDDFDVVFLKSLLETAVTIERLNVHHNNIYCELLHYLAKNEDTFSQRYLCYYHLYIMQDKNTSALWLSELVTNKHHLSKKFFKDIKWPNVKMDLKKNTSKIMTRH